MWLVFLWENNFEQFLNTYTYILVVVYNILCEWKLLCKVSSKVESENCCYNTYIWYVNRTRT